MSGVIGQRVLRLEDARFLEGKGGYVDNLELPGARHVTFVRSPFAHARITGIDVSAALALPGTQVFTAADVDLETFQPPPLPGLEQRMGRPYLASDTVRFNGDIVAIVLSDSRVQGMDAAALVTVDYDPLPAVVDPREALEDRTLLFPEVGTNVCLRKVVEEPDEELFAGCDVVVSGQLVSQRLAPCPLEPRSTAAVVGADGRLTAWLSTQTPHYDRHGLARGLRPGGGAGARGRARRRRRLRRQGALGRGRPGRLGGARDGPPGPLDGDARREHGRHGSRPCRRPRLHDRRQPGRCRARLPAQHPPGRGRVSLPRRLPAEPHGADGERRLRDPEDRGRRRLGGHEHDADRSLPWGRTTRGGPGDRASARPVRGGGGPRPGRRAPSQLHPA